MTISPTFVRLFVPRFITVAFICSALYATMLLSGCGGSHAATETAAPATETLAQAESRFTPSDYDTDPHIVKEVDAHGVHEKAADIVPPKIALDTVRGYRVQVMFSAEIEQASGLRDTLSSQFPGQWVYVIYDAPYYKVRLGNFADRGDANDMLRSVVRQGYPDAWVVPDNVVLNLPPRPANVVAPDSTANQGNR